jgi:hypothetical protein
MEITQGTSLCSYLYLKLAKMSCFSFYLFAFLLCKIREQEGGTGPAQREGLAPVAVGKWWGKAVREVQKLYTYAYKYKNDTC